MIVFFVWLVVFGGAFAMVAVFAWGLLTALAHYLLNTPPPPNTIVFDRPKRL